MHIKFETEIPKQTSVTLPKPCHPETEKSNMATRQPFRKWRRWKSIGSYPYIQVLCHLSLELIFKAKLKLESGNQKIQYGCLAAMLKLKLLKINRLLHIYISIVLLKFGVDIQSQTKVRVWKPKNPIWPPGGHFESDVAENQKPSAYDHHQHAYEVWNWNSKANLTYAPETMSSTDRRTDGRTDRWTDKVNPVYPPSNFVGRGYKNKLFRLILYIMTSVSGYTSFNN